VTARVIEVMAWQPLVPGSDHHVGRIAGASPAGDWQDGARCAEVDPELFFPGQGGTAQPAKRVCAACEVRSQCLEYAIESGQQDGVWGGLSERQLRALRLQRERDAGAGRCASGRHALAGDGNCPACSAISRKSAETKRLAA